VTDNAVTSAGDHPRNRRRHGHIVLSTAAGALILATGIAIGILIPIVRAPADASAEAGFARDMSTHHAQAVEMSMIVYGRSADPEVTALALDIALGQQGQIGVMKAWLDQWNLAPTSSRPAMAWMHDDGNTRHGGSQHTMTVTPEGLLPGMASKAELAQLRETTGRELNILFAQLMIRHHEAGLAMVNAILAVEPGDEVRDLATMMRNTQQVDINALTAVIARLQAPPR
jgi:uncharacterized protein (DUF305 family)